jgi:hypothetical protein
MTRIEFNKFLEEQARAILDKIAGKAIDWAAEKVANEEDVGDYTDKDMEEEEGANLGGVRADQMDLSQQQEEKENAKETFKGEAAIPEAVAAPLRSSPRLINSAGEHIMSKTGRRAAQRNLELNEGKSENRVSLLNNSFSAARNIELLGVRVGDLNSKGFSEIENLLVEKTADQQFTLLNNHESLLEYESSEEEGIDEIESSAIKSLCGDLLEEVYDDESYHLSCEMKASSRGQRGRAKSRKKKACRIALTRINKKVSG